METAYIPWTLSSSTLIKNVLSDTPWYTISVNKPHDASEDLGLDFPLPDDLFEEDLPEDPLREQRDPVHAISRVVPVQQETRLFGAREINEEFDWEHNLVTNE